jgi:hypothetical protein
MDAPAPPGKSEARRQTGRREKLTGLAEDNCGQHFAQACTHPATRTERLPDGSWHYARLTCAICGRFLRWLPRPETIERQKLNAFKLAKLAMCEGLSNGSAILFAAWAKKSISRQSNWRSSLSSSRSIWRPKRHERPRCLNG